MMIFQGTQVRKFCFLFRINFPPSLSEILKMLPSLLYLFFNLEMFPSFTHLNHKNSPTFKTLFHFWNEISLSAIWLTRKYTNELSHNFPVPKQVTEEPERIRKWREEQKARLEEKDREEERKKEELREQARKELEDWYKHHEESISKTKAANRCVLGVSLNFSLL